MKVQLGLLFLVFTIIDGNAALQSTPKITWSECPPGHFHYLCLEVNFNDEQVNDFALLDLKYPTMTECILEGHFQHETSTKVIVTGTDCPFHSNSHLQVSFASSRSPHVSLFDLRQPLEGQVMAHVSMKDKGLRDEMVYPPHYIENVHFATRFQVAENATPAADGYIMKVLAFYDTNFKAEFGDDSVTRVQAVFAHVENIYSFTTLNVPLKIELEGVEFVDYSYEASGDWLEFVNGLARADGRDVNAFAYMTFHNNEPGVAGIAWVGVVCDSDKGYRTSINEYFYTDLDSAEIVAHELGHNLNMGHDFDGSPGVERTCSTGESCTNINGVMDYYQPTVSAWTCCSNEDFLTYFNYFPEGTFCMAENDGGSGSTTTVEPTTSTSPPSCQDEIKTRKCEKLLAKGKCSKEKIWKKCMKTCGKCHQCY